MGGNKCNIPGHQSHQTILKQPSKYHFHFAYIQMNIVVGGI